MKWLPLGDDPTQKIYELRNKNERLMKLNYHPVSRTMRISTEGERRVLLVGREGFLKNRTVMRNEYGIKMGQLNHEGSDSMQGSIEISGEQFTYLVQSAARTALYKNGNIVVVCELPDMQANFAAPSHHDLLILSLCWYLSVIIKRPRVAVA